MRWAFAAVLVPLLFSRWGTYIGFGPLYVCDICFGLALINSLRTGTNKSDSLKLPATYRIFFFYFLTRLFFSAFTLGEVSLINMLRDSVPFAYVLFVPLGALFAFKSPRRVIAKAESVLYFALVVHAWWVGLVMLFSIQPIQVFSFVLQAPLFQVRPDFDSALVAVCIALSINRLRIQGLRALEVLTIMVGLFVVASVPTRAGLISFGLVLGLLFAALLLQRGIPLSRQTSYLFLGVSVAGILAAIFSSTLAGQRLLATLTGGDAVDSTTVGALGTSRARELVWQAIFDWMQSDTLRLLTGSGFGNNFLDQTESVSFLEGTTYSGVRSPHNYFVGAYARLGLVGVLVLISFLFFVGLRVFRGLPSLASSELSLFSGAIFVSLLTVGTLGVVLEAPFGAIPFYWCCGIIIGADQRARLDFSSDRQLG